MNPVNYGYSRLPAAQHDPRQSQWTKQREERGFDDTETWNLYQAIALFVIPRLTRFKEVTNGFPPDMTEEQWDEILQQMIDAFDIWTREDELDTAEVEIFEKANAGVELFAKYFTQLWW